MTNPTLPDHGAALDSPFMALRFPVVPLDAPAVVAACGCATLTATIETA